MAGFKGFVVGCVLSAASIITPAASTQAFPLSPSDAKIERLADVQTIASRGHRVPEYRGGHNRHYRPGYGYRPYRPAYGYRPYRPYYGYRPYRPYYRPYYRPGVSVYVTPRPYYNQGYGGSHVDWCLARYRSYNPATNRFLSYGGVYKVCNSPYR
ncbi:MAG TPA: BA14K family protein [Pararhizobium sp.]|uniref:BA14K family protein n=1 Tax=Pararhizobium sp. TaxID=1977563 RepID=UPI002C3AC4B5|nr:BA14K family protein [Pararhizobium sp.]HTO31917.1 BA14K family protein [Pararhizobium sp.]